MMASYPEVNRGMHVLQDVPSAIRLRSLPVYYILHKETS